MDMPIYIKALRKEIVISLKNKAKIKVQRPNIIERDIPQPFSQTISSKSFLFASLR